MTEKILKELKVLNKNLVMIKDFTIASTQLLKNLCLEVQQIKLKMNSK